MEEVGPVFIAVLLSFAVFLRYVNCFNMDLQAPVVQSIPEMDSYFGYSIAMHREDGVNVMLVGAPKYQTAAPDTDRGGALFKCPVSPYTNPASCQQLSQFDSLTEDFNNAGIRLANSSGQWFGASVRSGGEDKAVLACRPLYTWFIDLESDPRSRRDPIGGCYVAKNNFTDIQRYEPCRTSNPDEQAVFGITHCQAGIGADIRNNEILVGSPGSFFWQGQIWVDNSDLTAQRRTNEGQISFDDSYRGYAVAIGDFMGDSSPEYVVGTPRGRESVGEVSIFDATMTAYLNLTGNQVGAYFGHTLVVSDLNGDGLNDLVVSAPFFIDEQKTIDGRWEVGIVFIYYNDGNGGFRDEVSLLGYEGRSRFGFAMAALGDVNQDNSNDLAISAPYAGITDAGRVYIYHGNGARGLSDTPAQILEPSSFDLDLTSFGYSLSAGMDMDQNMYPDLLIGAYKSSTVVLVRSRPIVQVQAALTSKTQSIDLQEETYALSDRTLVSSFNLSVCITYYGTNVPASLDFQYTVVLDFTRPTLRRALFDLPGSDSSSTTRTINLQKTVQNCNILTAYVKPTIVDKLTPFDVSLNFRLADTTPDPGAILPLLDQSVDTYSTVAVPIQRNCRNATCMPNLGVTATANKQTLIVGDTDTLGLDIIISNRGEDAYLSILTVVVPTELHYVGFTRSNEDLTVQCSSSSQTSTIVCDVGNPFVANSTVNLRMDFSSENLPGTRENLLFNLRVSSVETELSTSDNYANVTVQAAVAASLSIFGVSNPEKVIYSEVDYSVGRHIEFESDVGPEVTHVFSLHNNGPSQVGQTVVTIPWPMLLNSSDSYLLYLISARMDTGQDCEIVGNMNPADIKPNQPTINEVPAVADSGRRRRATANDTIPTTTSMPTVTTEPPFTKQDLECVGSQQRFCYTINCTVDSLGAGSNSRDSVVINVRSRVWTNTLTDNALQLTISVDATAEVRDVPYTVPLKSPIEVTSNKVETSIIPTFLLKEEQPKEVELWIYLVAALGGVIILLVLILILWAAGFFKRKKITPEQRENLRSNHANDTASPNNAAGVENEALEAE